MNSQNPGRVEVDPIVATQIAAAHIEASRAGDALAHAAYVQLVRESDRLFRRVTEAGRPDRVRIFFTMCSTPYGSATELITSVRRDRILEVTTVASERDRLHPVMGCEVGGGYDRFRAVHDVLGHGSLQVGFDRDGEFAAWRFQERFHSEFARRALATELHGEHSVQWTTGDLPEHKALLLDERLLRRSRAGSADSRPRKQFWGTTGVFHGRDSCCADATVSSSAHRREKEDHGQDPAADDHRRHR